MDSISILSTAPTCDYALLDSGDGEKLERYGKIVFRRPDPQALWDKRLGVDVWDHAHASFRRDGTRGDWVLDATVPQRWQIDFSDMSFFIRPTSFKHTGLFPEQSVNWDWMRERIRSSRRPISVLNLFGYTGGATLAAAQAGASVVHVDGSKVAIQWGKDNAHISGLSDKPIRWILDDARRFVLREHKRGNRYDGIILDPPAFGHGPKKEMWKIEEHLPELLRACANIMSDDPVFFLINGYASGYSAIAYDNNLKALFKDRGGVFEKGELAIAESGSDRLLPCGITARWACA